MAETVDFCGDEILGSGLDVAFDAFDFGVGTFLPIVVKGVHHVTGIAKEALAGEFDDGDIGDDEAEGADE